MRRDELNNSIRLYHAVRQARTALKIEVIGPVVCPSESSDPLSLYALYALRSVVSRSLSEHDVDRMSCCCCDFWWHNRQPKSYSAPATFPLTTTLYSVSQRAGFATRPRPPPSAIQLDTLHPRATFSQLRPTSGPRILCHLSPNLPLPCLYRAVCIERIADPLAGQ